MNDSQFLLDEDLINDAYSVLNKAITNLAGVEYLIGVLASSKPVIERANVNRVWSNANNKVKEISKEANEFMSELGSFKKSLNMFGDDLYTNNLDGRLKTHDDWANFLDANGNGVNGLAEFGNMFGNFDYNSFYGDRIFELNGIVVNQGDFASLGADIVDFLCSGADDVISSFGDDVIDYCYDYELDPEIAERRFAASAFNEGIGVAKGLLKFGENFLVDPLLYIGASGVGKFLTEASMRSAAADSLNTDYAALEENIANMKNLDGMELASYEIVDNTFNEAYNRDGSFLNYVNNHTYDAADKDGSLYALAEGVGYYTGAIIVQNAIGGGSDLVKAVSQAGPYGIAKGFDNMENEYNELVWKADLENREITDEERNAVKIDSALTGATEGITMFAADYIPKVIGGSKLNQDILSTGLKTVKPFVTEGIDTLYEGDEYDLDKAVKDASATIISEFANMMFKNSRGLYDNKFSDTKYSEFSNKNIDFKDNLDVNLGVNSDASSIYAEVVGNDVIANIGNGSSDFELFSEWLSEHKVVEKAVERTIKDSAKEVYNNMVD